MAPYEGHSSIHIQGVKMRSGPLVNHRTTMLINPSATVFLLKALPYILMLCKVSLFRMSIPRE